MLLWIGQVQSASGKRKNKSMTLDINAHRKAIVRTLILRLRHPHPFGSSNIAYGQDIDNTKEYACYCQATLLCFPGYLSQNNITCSEWGDLWMGLWLGEEVRICEEDGFTLFPRWLAEVLNEECSLGIEEEDIYDD